MPASARARAARASWCTFTWFAQRQYWIVVWAIAARAIGAIAVEPQGTAQAITAQGLSTLMPIAIMPAALLAAMRMTAFVKNSFLEYDEREDEAKPYLGFFIKSTFIGVVLAAVVYLCGELMATTIFAAAQPWVVPTFLACFQGAAAVADRGNLRVRGDLLRRARAGRGARQRRLGYLAHLRRRAAGGAGLYGGWLHPASVTPRR